MRGKRVMITICGGGEVSDCGLGLFWTELTGV